MTNHKVSELAQFATEKIKNFGKIEIIINLHMFTPLFSYN